MQQPNVLLKKLLFVTIYRYDEFISPLVNRNNK